MTSLLSLGRRSCRDGDQVTDFWHKDAACPSDEILEAQFTHVATDNPDFNATAEEPVARVNFSPRRCDFLSFFGNNTDPADDPQFVMFLEENAVPVPEPLDPVLPNPNKLIGAVAATFDVTGESGAFLVNQRLICQTGDPDLSTCERPAQKGPNPHTQVRPPGPRGKCAASLRNSAFAFMSTSMHIPAYMYVITAVLTATYMYVSLRGRVSATRASRRLLVKLLVAAGAAAASRCADLP